EDLMKEIVDTIIPETDIPGANSLEVHNFVWVMADDCMESADQQKFMKGLSDMNRMLAHDRDMEFAEIEPADRAGILDYIMKIDESYDVPVNDDGTKEFNPDAIKYSLARIKGYTIQGFMQSQYVMQNIMPYELVPGPASGCVDVDPGKRVNIYG
ncbi:MAG: gluconate 2-dehydrogenase subunit 3 family protein, partial [Cyclobacteriaceae bacterium]